ncbi:MULTISPECIES: NifX-associated nitrogen fixation protein [Protofrankia]|uniref:Nitrogen fixation protein n=2 Tax=Candidatus Protofrankia datiscae TaxID=2716812 RepID=F8B5P7_9ACTN|nr:MULTISPECIES: NifX-associated nitrogen fixation protein [Protofrankia]AEH10135.1 nitrogen fixation protein [Candidatus Protofrankia datiscae]
MTIDITGAGTGGAGVDVTTGFLRDLIDQLRAGDTYGQLDRLGWEKLLSPFVLTPQRRRELGISCDVDPATEGRLRSFYQAVAAGIEKATGLVTGYLLDLSHEGFGRVTVFTGRLVVVSEVLRDAHRFGFDSIDHLAGRGEALVGAAAALVRAHPEVARDDS